MRRSRLWKLLGVLPLAALLAVALGCPKADTGSGDGGGTAGGSDKGVKVKGDMTELASTGWGTLKGRVTLQGQPPIDKLNENLKKAIQEKNEPHCLSATASEAEKTQQVWRVGEGNGLANVVVWLKPPEGNYFKVDNENPTWEKEVVVDQPHCAFIPHVVVLFPSYPDPKDKGKQKATGQVFKVKNTAPIAHNTKWDGGSKNPSGNVTLQSGKDIPIEVKPSNQEIAINCDIHKWMSGYAWAFDHPYAAVTDKDGNYEIKKVPAGVKVQVVAWHEEAKYLGKGKAKGDPIELKEGDNTHDFTAEAPK
jgi:hypothetical protein